MKKNLLYYALLLLLPAALFISCKSNEKPAVLEKSLFYGTWTMDKDVSFEQMKEMPDFKEGAEVLKDAHMAAKGTISYNSNGRYTMKGNIVLHMTPADSGDKVTMNFDFRETGKWELKDSTLASTTEDSEVAPVDDATKAMVAEDPDLLKEMRPVKGETKTDEIKSATKSEIELYDRETKLTVKMKKQ